MYNLLQHNYLKLYLNNITYLNVFKNITQKRQNQFTNISELNSTTMDMTHYFNNLNYLIDTSINIYLTNKLYIRYDNKLYVAFVVISMARQPKDRNT